jgi:hypothetical protein
MRREPQGLEKYANTDPSLHFNRLPRAHRGLTWQSVWIYLLKTGDEEAAQLVRDQNPTLSFECEGDDHDDCHHPSCECTHHRATVLKTEHEPLKSCAEVASEQDEREFEASLR